MRVIVCGRRTWTNPLPIWTVLQGLKAEANETEDRLTVIEGGAKGADVIAGRWAGSQPDVDHVVVPAEWGRYGRAAGPRRNAQMLELEPRLVVAFATDLKPFGKGGTEDMVNRAIAAGVSVWTLGALYPCCTGGPGRTEEAS